MGISQHVTTHMTPNLSWLQSYPLDVLKVEPFGGGLINETYRIDTDQGVFIGQRLNTQVFPYPDRIAFNVRSAARYLAQKDENYLFLAPILTNSGQEWAIHEGDYWRLTPFVPNSYAISVVETPALAFAAARGFGELTRQLDGLDVSSFQETIPHFHHLPLRITQAHDALREASSARKSQAKSMERLFDQYQGIGDHFDRYWQHPDMPKRLLHHDTKISNILFAQKTEQVLAVCDLDTLMPGIILSDLGDMVRTYTCSAAEESTDWSSLTLQPKAYAALHQGYLQEMQGVLTSTEREALFWAGPSLLYMQAIRFLTDYWLGDVYYKTQRPNQNLDRVRNQFILLEQLMENPGFWRGLIPQ